MKQIIAILRDERVEETKEALETIGVRGVTFLYVTGRGQQKGRGNAQELSGPLNMNQRMQLENSRPGDEPLDAGIKMAGSFQPVTEFALGFLPKRMLIIVAYDEEVSRIIQAILDVNQSGRYGDGRIFICPMIGAIRVRTGELGDKALS
jgi:nitrogen regulatory protein PII 2